MSAAQELRTPTEGRFVQNIVHFTRALRKAGVQVGTAQLQTAISAVRATGFSNRFDYYFTLRATLITRPEHMDVFHQVFFMFWRDPEYLERMIHLLSPLLRREDQTEKKEKAANRRALDALTDNTAPSGELSSKDELQADAHLSWSQNEILRHMDFEQMSAAEATAAARAIQQLSLPIDPLLTRRLTPSIFGRRPDARATLARAIRRGGEIDRLLRKAPRKRPPNLVALCDISGSMSVYSRMMLHLLHGLHWSPNPTWGQVSAFTFGTRLTNISKSLRKKDVDDALASVGQLAPDWQGGTRIGDALFRFNRDWGRRVLGQGTAVLLITDGLERDTVSVLAAEIARLSRSCRRLIWLNPLLRWQEFTPKAAGIKAILPHVDEFLPCHSLDSLGDLTNALSGK